jgi:CDP-glucose 4,6-dehydratase
MDSLRKIFNNKTVLLTGHTGFKGSWLSLWLHSLGAKVVGLSIDVPSTPSNFVASNVNEFVEDNRVDIRNADEVNKIVLACQPDFVFHLAAQALVRPSYESPLDTISTNAMGTACVLDALRILDKPVVAVMITSDKAYDNVEWVWGYRETDRLGGRDPYSASKGMAELVIHTYVESFFNTPDSNVRVGIVRAGNVIGGGDWASDRIVSDSMLAWSCGQIVDIRSPDATRPWQHVLEPLSGYLSLAAELSEHHEKHGQAYNFGPPANQNYTVRALIDEMTKYWDNVRWNDVSQQGKHLHEAGLLKLNCDKALVDLDWLPTLQFEDTVRMTVEWYKEYYQLIGSKELAFERDISMSAFTLSQIEEYTKLGQDNDRSWAK